MGGRWERWEREVRGSQRRDLAFVVGVMIVVVVGVLGAMLLMSGCEHVSTFNAAVTCAPRTMVVGCLNEAFRDDPNVGLGPWCSSLAAWARAEGWELGSEVKGGGVIAEREAQEERRRIEDAKRHRGVRPQEQEQRRDQVQPK